MPMYGFVCQECGQSFEELVFSQSAIQNVTCPSCNSSKIERQLSRVAAMTLSGGSALNAGAACSTGGG